jgi:hypothetical protein
MDRLVCAEMASSTFAHLATVFLHPYSSTITIFCDPPIAVFEPSGSRALDWGEVDAEMLGTAID